MKSFFTIHLLVLSFLALQAQDVQKIHNWRWERMKPSDLEQAIKTIPVVYYVISPLEWHGEALSFGTDVVIGTAIAEKAWNATGGVLIPTVTIGSETEYKDWTSGGLTEFWGMEWVTKEHNPGSLYISNLTFELVVREMLSFLEKEGFKACVIVSGHGATEYVRILKEFERQSEHRPMKIIYSDLVSTPRPAEIEFPGATGHADFAEASILGAVDSTLVDKSLFGINERDQKTGLFEKNTGLIDYEKGRMYINYRADRIIETVKQFLKNSNTVK